ncbi:conjugal transfer protein TraF [Komagataeibacter xylinus]|uniref:Conjugal transfer protein TraF n=1 Tax=Komagataeibacter xylinus TaxID=28448 RepID=A0A318PHU4_KOMXY|nr:S26 family signal peptidase [Komagataeibacter xylinus]PYD55695.1 conjugal transfer protein TraF [Komagataeibacter xylinus]GBQ74219.1 conjugal transfer protein precursor [Komagataeibacter xylinus NBRC 15237]
MTRRAWFFGTYFVVLAVGVSAAVHIAPRLLWNSTASVPVGLYRLRADSVLHVGDIIALHLPDRLALLLSQRGYLPLGVPLLKPVAALPGQTVCRANGSITIDGRHVGDALTSDHRGRPLPVWQGCRRLGRDEIFVMNPAEPRSLDGRYFGPLPASTMMGRAIPIWLTTGRIAPGHDERPHPVLLSPPLQ